MTEDPSKIGKPVIKGIVNPVLASGHPHVGNQCVTRYPNGSCVIVDYNKGNEHIRVENMGSSITLCPDGSVKVVSAAGKMGLEINGEGYIKITGLYTIEADGDIGIVTKGKCDFKVAGDMNFAVTGGFNVTSKDMNLVAAEKFDVGAESITINGVKTLVTSSTGTSVKSYGPVELYSTGETVDIFSSGETKIRGETINLNPTS